VYKCYWLPIACGAAPTLRLCCLGCIVDDGPICQRGALLGAGRGIYVLPVESRFGTHAPSTSKMIEGLASQRGETIVLHGAAAANALGLTAQVPMKAIYLTSGRNRRSKVGAQTVEFRHAPIWQLMFPGRTAGDVVRALAWLGPEKAGEALRKFRSKLPPSELEEVVSARARLPTWMAQESSLISGVLTRRQEWIPAPG
jgi:hypothetical protein